MNQIHMEARNDALIKLRILGIQSPSENGNGT